MARTGMDMVRVIIRGVGIIADIAGRRSRGAYPLGHMTHWETRRFTFMGFVLVMGVPSLSAKEEFPCTLASRLLCSRS
jgi:hypothetical protein